MQKTDDTRGLQFLPKRLGTRLKSKSKPDRGCSQKKNLGLSPGKELVTHCCNEG